MIVTISEKFDLKHKQQAPLTSHISTVLRKLSAIILVTGVSACMEPYTPEIPSGVLNILSVTGFINASDGTASVELRKVQSVNEEQAALPENGATVLIEMASGKTFVLGESAPGNYSASVPIDFNDEYTMKATTADGRQLLSSPIRLQRSAPLIKLSPGVTVTRDALTINSTSATDNSVSPYYAWTYTETFEYTTKYFSGFKKVNELPVARIDEEQVYRCWKTSRSTKIVIANTVALDENVITNFPVAFVPKGTPELSVRYSILVRQRNISREEYDFLNDVRQTTETVGGFFDPIPFPVAGNIVESTDPKTPVLGYFSGSEVSEKRFFITSTELPEEIQAPPSYPADCEQETTCDSRLPPRNRLNCLNVRDLSVNFVFLSALLDPAGNAYSYFYSHAKCADCTFQGGVTKKPDFW